MKNFEARWGWALIAMSIFATALCIAISGVLGIRILERGDLRGLWACVLPLTMVAVCALFTVRGYTIAPDAIYIQRLLWATRLPTDGLQSVTFQPNAMRWSLRTMGNGGLFSFTGRYWSRALGSYRAFVADLNPTVVLRYPNQTVVLSPTLPEKFVYELVSPPV